MTTRRQARSSALARMPYVKATGKRAAAYSKTIRV
jgi:hypothetical protein